MIVREEYEFKFDSFEFWSGGQDVAEEIRFQDREQEAQEIIEEYMCKEACTETEINDFVWFELADIMELYNKCEDEEEDEEEL